MHYFRIPFFVFSVFLLVGCAKDMPQVVGSSPATVSICSGAESMQAVIDKAQAECQKYGKNAELTNDKGEYCVPDGLTWAYNHLKHFRCVVP